MVLITLLWLAERPPVLVSEAYLIYSARFSQTVQFVRVRLSIEDKIGKLFSGSMAWNCSHIPFVW